MRSSSSGRKENAASSLSLPTPVVCSPYCVKIGKMQMKEMLLYQVTSLLSTLRELSDDCVIRFVKQVKYSPGSQLSL